MPAWKPCAPRWARSPLPVMQRAGRASVERAAAHVFQAMERRRSWQRERLARLGDAIAVPAAREFVDLEHALLVFAKRMRLVAHDVMTERHALGRQLELASEGVAAHVQVRDV